MYELVVTNGSYCEHLACLDSPCTAYHIFMGEETVRDTDINFIQRHGNPWFCHPESTLEACALLNPKMLHPWLVSLDDPHDPPSWLARP